MESFQELVLWRKAHELFLRVAEDVERFPPKTSPRTIAGKLIRSTGSISTNIAEGWDRRSGAEYIHSLTIARGSTHETLNWLIKPHTLIFIDEDTFSARKSSCLEILPMLNPFIGTLRKKQANRRNSK